MNKAGSLLAALAAILVSLAFAAPAHSAKVTWIAHSGSDANNCTSPTTPCRTFNAPTGAFAKTDAGGVINVLPGEYSVFIITKSIHIVADGGQASNTAATVVGSVIASFVVDAGAAGVVRIRGFVLDRLGFNGGGIGLVTGAALYIENCTIVGSVDDFGIQFEPTGASELYVTNSTISDNGNASAGGGILVQPSGSGSANVVIDNVRAENNRVGIFVNRSLTTGAVNVNVRNSTIAGNTSGLVVNASGAVARVSGTTISANANGLLVFASGQIISHGGNVLAGNTTNGAFTSTLPQQ